MPRALESDGLDLEAIITGRDGELSPTACSCSTSTAWDARSRPTASTTDARRLSRSSSSTHWRPAAIYALLAIGYALIYGITGRINLAFGEFTTFGASRTERRPARRRRAGAGSR